MKLLRASFCLFTLAALPLTLAQAGTDGTAARLHEGYGLLHDLADQEKNADGIFLFKHAPDATKENVRQLVAVFKRIDHDTEAWLKADGLDPATAEHLPQVEAETRKAIQSQRAHEIFAVKGDPFDRLYLRLQEQSATYGMNLLAATRKYEGDAEREKALAAFERDLRRIKARLDAQL